MRLQRLFYGAALGVTALCSGCGKAATPSGAQVSTLPPPHFSLELSASALAVSQGASSTVNISVNAQHGFTGTVEITLSGLPNGVASNPSSPFSVAAASSTAVVFGAAANAATGNFTVTALGSNGSLSHSVTLALTVNASPAAALPRTNFVRIDSVPTLDDPAGEPHHRHLAYDPANKRVFIANRGLNRVEVFSSVTQARVAQISIPGASSVDLSADGATVWVGTLTEQVAAIGTSSLQVRTRYTPPALSPVPNTAFDRPEELVAMASGKLMMRLRQASAAQALLALWDPVANNVTNLTSVAPGILQNGVGAMARTGGGTGLVVAANDSSGQLAVFDANGNIVVAPRTLGTGTIPLVAANFDGTRYAAEFVSNGIAQLFLLDGNLNQAGAPLAVSARGLTFSRDATLLYVSQNNSSVILALSAANLASLGQIPDASIQTVTTEIEDADETQLLFGISNRGVSFIDASQPATLSAMAPSFVAASVAQPSGGPAAGGTSVSVAGQNFESGAQLKFGSQLSNSVNVLSLAQIQAVTPASVINGPANLTAYFPSGWLAIAPDAFSYGPQILKVLPNAGTKIGGEPVQIYGYGFGSDPAKITVTVGSSNATVVGLENVAALAASLGFDATYPFPLERITAQTPSGNPGNVDIVVTSAAGTAAASNAFQYLQNEQVFAKPALYKFVLYDQKRQWLYLSSTDHVDVFDLAAGQFHSTPLTPPGGPPPNAALRGLALTPDGAQLIVADFGAQSIYLINPDTGSGTIVPVGGVAGFLNSGPASVAATSLQTVFVGMSGEGGASGACNSCLSQLNLAASPPTVQPAPQPEVTKLTGAPLVQANRSGSTVFLAFDAAPGGPIGVWNASSPNQFTTSLATQAAIDLATAADGTSLVTRTRTATEFRGPDLILAGTPASAELEQIPGRVLVPGVAMHPTGALVYQPFVTGPPPATPPATNIQGGVDIIDAHSGYLRTRVFLPEAFAMLSTDTDALHGSFLAVDENGQRIFALTTSGLTVVHLAQVPLGIGTISAATAAASGGTILTIRGSGFQSGATVNIGGKPAATTFVDMNTLTVVTPALVPGPQQVIIKNPSGDSVALDAAIVAN